MQGSVVFPHSGQLAHKLADKLDIVRHELIIAIEPVKHFVVQKLCVMNREIPLGPVDLGARRVIKKQRVVHMQVVGAFLPREVAIPRQSLRVAGVGEAHHGKGAVRRGLERNHLERRESADRLGAEVENRLFSVMQNLSAPA